jgi:homoserine kinase type II
LDTSKMLQLERLDADKALKMLIQSKDICAGAASTEQALEQFFLYQQLKQVVEQNYDIGTVTDLYEMFGGYINRSFAFRTEKDGQEHVYFIRKYSKGKNEKEILLEHNLLACARKNGANEVAGTIPAHSGKTYVQAAEGSGADRLDYYFAVYNFLEGEDKYNWVDNELSPAELASAAEVIATFHNAVKDFDPHDWARQELPILELLPTLRGRFTEWANIDVKNIFTDYYRKNLPRIIEVINSLTIPREDWVKMPVNPLQCDCHPGNMKFQDNKVVGIFDFDWSKVDLRIFEIGLGLVYFCASWISELDGVVHLDRCKIFLEAYQKQLQRLGGLAPLNATEKHYFPEMLNAGNIYLILWCIRAYYEDLTLNVYEYLFYLQHQVKCMNWVDEHREEIVAMISEI